MLRKGVATFRMEGTIYHSDTCEPLRRAAGDGQVVLRAFARGGYPGERIPDGVLQGVKSIGYWHAEADQDWYLDWHRNEGIELTFLAAGSFRFDVAEAGTFELMADQLTVTRPWQPHRVGYPCLPPNKLYWLILDVGVRRPNQEWRWPSWIALSATDLERLTQLLRGNEHPVWPAGVEIRQCFARLDRLLESGDPGREESALRLLINSLLLETLRMLEREDPDLDPALASSERTVKLFLESLPFRLDEAWDLPAMAAECGLGKSSFSLHCWKLTGMSPKAYLSWLRIERAKELLRRGQHSITEVAMACGFSSSQYFATVFRAHTGCSPTQYLREDQALQASGQVRTA